MTKMIELMPGASQEEFNDYLKNQTLILTGKMADKDMAMSHESKREVDNLCGELVKVLHAYQLPEGHEQESEDSRLLIMNRAVSYLHLIVGRWFAEVAASGAVMRRVEHEALTRHWHEIDQKNAELKDTVCELMLALKEQAIESIPAKYRARKKRKVKKVAKKAKKK